MPVAVDDLDQIITAALDVDPSLFPDEALAAELFALQRTQDRLGALIAQRLQTWDTNGTWRLDGSRSPGLHLARETGIGNEHAHGAVLRARHLQNMPETMAAWSRGLISQDHVDLLVRIYKQQDIRQLFLAGETELVSWMQTNSWADAKQLVSTWISTAFDALGINRAAKQRAQRSLTLSRTLDGVVHANLTLDAIGGEILTTEIERLEKLLFEEDWNETIKRLGTTEITTDDLLRTAPQRRADALVEMAKRSAATAPGSTPARPLISITCGTKRLTNILQLRSGAVLSERAVAEMLDDVVIQHLVYPEDDLQPIRASKMRSFRGLLRRALEIRDEHCTDPSVCDVRSSRCQADHIDPSSNGGRTEYANGQMLCAFHNRLKGASVFSASLLDVGDDPNEVKLDWDEAM